MSRSDSRSWLDNLVGAAVSILVAAVAIYVAVHLIESVLLALIVILLVASLLGVAVVIFRARYRGW